MYEIYRHTHVASQKCYVGLTKNGWRARLHAHVSAAKRGSRLHFHCALVKYGADAFTHEVLETCETLEAANEAEAWWIAHFGCDDPALGYNLDAGGKSRGVSDLTRQRMSVALKARTEGLSREERNKVLNRIEWPSIDVARAAIRGWDRESFDIVRQVIPGGPFPPGSRFPRVYGCTYAELRDGARGDERVPYLSADAIRPKIQGIRKEAYQAMRHDLGPEYPDATLFPDVYGMTYAHVRDGVRGHHREWPSEEDARAAIQGMTYGQCTESYASLGLTHPDNFPRIYGKSFTEVRDGVKSLGRFKPGSGTRKVCSTRT